MQRGLRRVAFRHRCLLPTLPRRSSSPSSLPPSRVQTRTTTLARRRCLTSSTAPPAWATAPTTACCTPWGARSPGRSASSSLRRVRGRRWVPCCACSTPAAPIVPVLPAAPAVTLHQARPPCQGALPAKPCHPSALRCNSLQGLANILWGLGKLGVKEEQATPEVSGRARRAACCAQALLPRCVLPSRRPVRRRPQRSPLLPHIAPNRRSASWWGRCAERCWSS